MKAPEKLRDLAHCRLDRATIRAKSPIAELMTALATITEQGRGCDAFDKHDEADEANDLLRTLGGLRDRLQTLNASLAVKKGGDDR